MYIYIYMYSILLRSLLKKNDLPWVIHLYSTETFWICYPSQIAPLKSHIFFLYNAEYSDATDATYICARYSSDFSLHHDFLIWSLLKKNYFDHFWPTSSIFFLQNTEYSDAIYISGNLYMLHTPQIFLSNNDSSSFSYQKFTEERLLT